MDRRSLLMGLTALAIAQTACQGRTGTTLRIAALKDVLPPQVLAEVKRLFPAATRLQFKTKNSSVDLFEQLQQWHLAAIADGKDTSASAAIANWVCLSDYWLFAAIQQGLISPLQNVDELEGWSELPEVWRSLFQRNDQGLLDDSGPLWATPYRWGHLMMVYARPRFERLGWQPASWEDLWRPEIQERIALPNHPRIVLGLVLKALGYSANDLNPATHAEVRESLEALSPQVKIYTSDDYLQALIMGDIWLAVGWSTEIQPILERYRQLEAVSPTPGTLLTADVWVKPNTQAEAAAASLSELDRTWLTYWWQPEVVTPLSLFSQGLSPLLVDPAVRSQALDFSEAAVLIPTADQLRDSEFIVPLPEEAIASYDQLWRQLRRSK